jgi:aminoglycoside phosphotransferase (APT) family kinase protein
MIAGDLLRQVPGCEEGEPPYSQELIGGGGVNRSYLVRTRRGRFVVRLNDNSISDPGLDRDRELALHSAAASAGIAPPVIHAAPDRSSLITEFVDGRLWTPWPAHASVEAGVEGRGQSPAPPSQERADASGDSDGDSSGSG